MYGLKAVKWFEKGLDRGLFTINNQKVHSVFVFDSFKRFVYLLDSVGTQRIWPARAFTLGHLTHNDLASVRIAKRAMKSL